MNNNIKSIKLGAPESIAVSNCGTLDKLDVQITERLESISFKGNTGTSNPFERAADLLRQQEEEMSKEQDDSIELSIPPAAILNGGDTICSVNGNARDYYWKLNQTAGNGNPTIDQRGNIKIEDGKWAEFDVRVKRYANNASWKSVNYLYGFKNTVPQLFSKMPDAFKKAVSEDSILAKNVIENVQGIIQLLDEYIPLSYIECIGNSVSGGNTGPCINTGITDVFRPRVVMEANITETQNQKGLFGTQVGHFAAWTHPGNKITYHYGNGTFLNQVVFPYQEWHKFDFSKEVYIDDVLFSSAISAYPSTPSNLNLYIFKCYANYYPAKMQLKVFKYYEDGALVSLLIPAKRKTDNTLGLFDVVRRLFLVNVGTDYFLKGAPMEDYRVFKF